MAKGKRAEGPEEAPLDMSAFGVKAEGLSLEAETLVGDVRDTLLSHVRSIRVPWTMLGEDEQSDKINALTSCAQDLVRRSIAVVVDAGFPSLVVNVGSYKVDKGVEVKILASPTVENITLLAQHGKGSAVLVLAEASAFFGERQSAKADKDQPDLPLGKDGD